MNDLNPALGRVESVANRVFGIEPVPTAQGGGAALPSGQEDQLRVFMAGIGEQLCRLERAVERIERI